MESFFGSLKSECRALEKSLSPQDLKLALFDYIEGFYNTHRIQTALAGPSPREYARKAVGAAACQDSSAISLRLYPSSRHSFTAFNRNPCAYPRPGPPLLFTLLSLR